MYYRKKFGISYQDFIKMPYKTFLIDLEMLNIEGQMKNGNNRKNNSSTNRQR